MYDTIQNTDPPDSSIGHPFASLPPSDSSTQSTRLCKSFCRCRSSAA